MRSSLLIVPLLILNNLVYCQKQSREVEYYNKVKSFYDALLNQPVNMNRAYELFNSFSIEYEEFLFFKMCHHLDCDKEFEKKISNKENHKSLFFEEISKSKNLLFEGQRDSIFNVIDKSSLYYDENSSSVSLDLVFKNDRIIYFYLNSFEDEPVYITNIFLENGESFFNMFELDEKTYLRRLGIINDSDGYTNVRNRPSNNSKIISQIQVNTPFYFTPNSHNKWWKIESIDGTINGYMHCSRIKTIGKYTKIK